MVDGISAQAPAPQNDPNGRTSEASEGSDLERFFEAILDPDGARITVGAASEGGDILGMPFGAGEVSVEFEYTDQDGASLKGNAEVTPKSTSKEGGHGLSGGGNFSTHSAGGTVEVSLFGMNATRTERRSENGAKQVTYEISLPEQLTKSMPDRVDRFLDKLPDKVRDAWRGPAGLVADFDAKAVLTEVEAPDGEVTVYGGVKLEASPSDTLTLGGVVDLDKFKAFTQVDVAFKDDEIVLPDLPEDGIATRNPPQSPLDTYGVFNPETRPGYVGTVELSPEQSVIVTADGRMVAGMETMRPETALALENMVREVTVAEYEAKAENAGSDAERIENEAVAKAIRGGASIRKAQNLGVDVQAVQAYHGETRNAEALIADSRDNGFIDGSNLPEARVGDETYAISTGGGVMHGRTTMTPSEITARANAHAANGGEVDGGMVAKARADAMGQSLRDGFSAKEQVSVDDGVQPAPGDRAAAMRQSLEAMVDAENGVALDARERKALDGMIAEVRGIEEAARFKAAKGVADNEYDLAMQMQEQRALDDMIAEAEKLEVLGEVPIPAFKPGTDGSVRSESDRRPDMRGDEVAYGRGTVFTDRTGRTQVAFESFSDWGAAIRDSFNGNPAQVGVAIPNAREIAEQNAAQKQEGGENNGVQVGEVPEAGSKENDAATSDEFDAMGSGSNAGPDKDEEAKADDKASTSGRDDDEPGENNGADIGGSNNASDNYGAPGDGIY